jgi:hypothetical protein
MNVTEVLTTLQTYLNQEFAVPVKVSGGNERPVPAILLENWDVSNIREQEYVDSKFDDNGYESARIYHTPYDLNVDFLLRAPDALEASQLGSGLRDVLDELENDPTKLSDHIARVMASGAGGISYQYANPTESETRQSATITAAHVYVDEDVQPITEVQVDLEIIDS